MNCDYRCIYWDCSGQWIGGCFGEPGAAGSADQSMNEVATSVAQ
ncbi:hypothetical protein VRK_31830 [Vibrio sp. MEBiC08052]|nr:hypothetical protein VRK_31830 [Vibrio sp. MEBiC08052]